MRAPDPHGLSSVYAPDAPMPGVLTRGPGPVTVWLVLSTVSPGWLAAQSLDRPLFQEVERWGRVVAPGVEHVRLTGRAGPDAAPWRAHLPRVDLRRSRLEVALALDQVVGQEAPSSAVRRRGAIAGVNGGFPVSDDPWNVVPGDPDGFVVVEGEVVSEGVADRPAIGFCTDGGRQRVEVVRPRVHVGVRSSDGVLEPTGLNRAREEDDDFVVYTPRWSRTTLAEPGGV
ncbi:MAG: hypothetical protein R3304_11130, partial [Longimicrobiales bacterium]|nr:hypothetical protein [Longimicrobiales bacterium]